LLLLRYIFTSLYLCDVAAAHESCLNVTAKHVYQGRVSSWLLYISYLYYWHVLMHIYCRTIY